MDQNPNRFDDVNAQLTLLAIRLRVCTDPEQHRTLLRDFRVLLAEAEKMVLVGRAGKLE